MEKISLRDPLRSDTFNRSSEGHSCRMVGPTRPRLQDDFQNIPAQEKDAGREKRGEILANRSAGWDMRRPWEKRSGSRGFPADNVVPFNDRGHAHPCTAVFHSALDTHHFAQG